MKPAFVLSALLAIASPALAAVQADLVLSNGRIFTGDTAQPWAEAVAIRGETIAAVGSNDEVARLAGPATRRVDLGGKLVIPGINDAHLHEPFGSGERAVRLAIPPDATAESIVALVAAETKKQPAGTLITGQLPVPLIDAAPTRAGLDRVAPAHPVRLAPPGGHSALFNSAALTAWHIDDAAADPPGGWYGRDGERLDGWLHEHAYWLPQQALAKGVSDDTYVENLKAFEDEALRFGITSVQTMPLIAAERTERLLAGMAPRLRWRVIDFRMAPFDGSPAPRPIKYILDGTPIERGAAMRAPYADVPAGSGRINYTPADIDAMVANAATGDSQLLVHVSGDASAAAVLQAMKKHPDVDWPARRVRLEHGDALDDGLVALVRELGVVVVQNPAHFQKGLAPARYGAERGADMQKARSLQAAGIAFALGSDGPLNPYLNLMFAAGHWNPDEALTVEDGLRAYTAGSAYAEFAEKTKGRIAPGMLADLAVLSQDITQVPVPALPGTGSVMTIVGGKVAWEAKP